MANWISLPSHFVSGLVLQQQAKTRLPGQTDPNLDLSLEMIRKPFDNRSVSPLDPQYGIIYTAALRSDKAGFFTFDLPALKASFDPIEIVIQSGKQQHKISRVLVGELFLLLGDAKPHTLLSETDGHALSELSSIPYLRFFDLNPASLVMDVRSWTAADQSDQLKAFSAAGILFGREMIIELRVPIGIIALTASDKKIREWYPGAKKTTSGRLLMTLKQISLRGVIWSGSSQDALAALKKSSAYTADLIKLTELLRELLLPVEGHPAAFLMLLHPIASTDQKSFFQQTLANESLSYCAHHIPAPAALIPVAGTNPTQLPSVLAHRLKTVCLGLLFQRKAPASAPECASIEPVGGKLMISFSNTGDGLRLHGEDTRLRGFAVCGPDRVFKEAQAKVLYGVRVLVWHDDIPNPVGVTYAFSDNQTGNLISKDQLPVIPFRSDQIESQYALPREWAHCEDPKVWQTFEGSLMIAREKANKTEGEASLRIQYQSEKPTVVFGPVIDRREDFPPLDLSGSKAISLDIFNPDRIEKTIQLKILFIDAPGAREITTETLKIPPALRWQTLTYDLTPHATAQNLTQIIRIKILLTDKNQRGMIYLDNIR